MHKVKIKHVEGDTYTFYRGTIPLGEIEIDKDGLAYHSEVEEVSLLASKLEPEKLAKLISEAREANKEPETQKEEDEQVAEKKEVTKAQAVREAIETLGFEAKGPEIQEWVKEKYPDLPDVASSEISNAKSKMKKKGEGGAGEDNLPPLPPPPSTRPVDDQGEQKDEPEELKEEELADLVRSLRRLMVKHGVERIRYWTEILTK